MTLTEDFSRFTENELRLLNLLTAPYAGRNAEETMRGTKGRELALMAFISGQAGRTDFRRGMKCSESVLPVSHAGVRCLTFAFEEDKLPSDLPRIYYRLVVVPEDPYAPTSLLMEETPAYQRGQPPHTVKGTSYIPSLNVWGVVQQLHSHYYDNPTNPARTRAAAYLKNTLG